MEQNKNFSKLSVVVVVGFLALTVLIFAAAGLFNRETYQIIFYIFALCLLVVFIALLVGFFGMLGILSERKKSKSSTMGSKTGIAFTTRLALKVFMPLLLSVSSFFNYKRDEIRRVYIYANNAYIESRRIKVSPEKLLVILPHCLQSSQCRYRIRKGLDDCHQCSACNLGDIKAIVQRYGVQVELATGGTSARKIILDTKPELVLAVACERDLTSGIMDVKGLPAYGLLNQRPNGPCRDTFVEIDELEETIQRFIL